MSTYNTYDTNLSLIVHSSRLGGTFICHRFREYNIDIDLGTDANSFDVVLKNPNGVYSSLFSKFDTIDILLNGTGLLYGRVDTAMYHHSSDNYVKVSGRNMSMALIDNDALPDILYNINPSEYITRICNYYGIYNVNINCALDIVKKYIISVGESELAVISKLIEPKTTGTKHIWSDYNTMYVGDWNRSGSPIYTFVCNSSADTIGIPILSLDLSDDGSAVYSECIIYGSTSSGNEKIAGTYKNDYMVGNNIHRRLVQSKSDDQDSDQCDTEAQNIVMDSFNNSIELQISIYTKNYIIKPNTVARVIDSKLKIDSTFFIKKVTYSKSLDEGSITTIYMIPSDSSNNTMYSNQGNLSGGITGK